jgi:hypothetical protein
MIAPGGRRMSAAMTNCGGADDGSAIAPGTAVAPALRRVVDHGDVVVHRGRGITLSCRPRTGITR